MADAVTQFSTLSNDAPNVWIAQRQFVLAERNLILGRYAEKFQLPQRMGKTMRVTRHKRLALPIGPLTEGTPPDAVALSIETVDVTVEQWGIVSLLTDVVQLTLTHPALQKAIDLTGLALSEVLEREIAKVLLGGTTVYFGKAATSRAGLVATDVIDTALVIKITTGLRARGAMPFEGQVYSGVLAPQHEGDLLKTDTTFQNASNFANVRALQYAELGVWMGVRWSRGNFLPIFKGVAAPDAAAVTSEKAQVTAVDGGGTIVSATNFKFQVVARDLNSDYERKISVASANILSTATGNNESFTVALPTSLNYTYDVYMSAAGGAGSLFLVASRKPGNTTVTITAAPAGTEATAPAGPGAAVSVFVGWVFGKDSFGRVDLNGMSMQSYITPAGASWSNPLGQGRKVGSKIMWKCFILDNAYFARFETGSSLPDELPA